MSLQIDLQNISKKHSNHYILRDFSFVFKGPGSYAILGANGSGKSTLMKLLSGLHSPSKGDLKFQIHGNHVPVETVYQHISLAAPWSDVIEELTLRECISFYYTFRKPLNDININEILEISGLKNSSDKIIHHFTSGMKQRVRLLFAFLTDSEIILLDEPTSNLDATGKQWYRSLVTNYQMNRLLIVASNHLPEEYDFCKEVIELS